MDSTISSKFYLSNKNGGSKEAKTEETKYPPKFEPSMLKNSEMHDLQFFLRPGAFAAEEPEATLVKVLRPVGLDGQQVGHLGQVTSGIIG